MSGTTKNQRVEILNDGSIVLYDSDTDKILYTGTLSSIMEYEIELDIPMSYIMSEEDYQNKKLQDFRIWLESISLLGSLYDRFPDNQGLLSFVEC